jgi:anti-sigma B factor antagonist
MHEASEESLAPQRSANVDPRMFADRFSTDGDHVLVASGEIDLHTAPKLWEALALLIERGHREVVLDMAEVEFIDSQGIAAIVRAQKRLAPEGGTVIVRGPRPQAREVFEVTGLSQLIELED